MFILAVPLHFFLCDDEIFRLIIAVSSLNIYRKNFQSVINIKSPSNGIPILTGFQVYRCMTHHISGINLTFLMVLICLTHWTKLTPLISMPLRVINVGKSVTQNVASSTFIGITFNWFISFHLTWSIFNSIECTSSGFSPILSVFCSRYASYLKTTRRPKKN